MAYNETQYTPSAQEAATGAYSAQKPQQTQPVQNPPPQQGTPAEQAKKGKHKPAQTQTVPTLVTAPGEQNASQVMVPQTPAAEVPVPGNPANATTDGLTDE